jgi:hypothetical protein
MVAAWEYLDIEIYQGWDSPMETTYAGVRRPDGSITRTDLWVVNTHTKQTEAFHMTVAQLLTSFGADGWELVAAIGETYNGPGGRVTNPRYFLKRPA